MSRFRQVVYSLVPMFRSCKEILVNWTKDIADKAERAGFRMLLSALVVFIFFALVIRAALAMEYAMGNDGSATIRLSAEEVQQCFDEGGCTFVTDQRLQQEIHEAMQRGADAVKGKYCI